MRTVPTRSRSSRLRPLLVLAFALPAQARDSFIGRLAAQVEKGNVTATIGSLQGFGTRYALTPSCDAAGDWLQAALAGYGLEVSFEDFVTSGKTLRNVVARHPGVVNPGRVFLLGAHYDSTSGDPWNLAPGADDDASGVAAVLETARILAGHRFENTLELVAFSGEELGMRGSEANAAAALASGKDIAGMVNLDMIGYWPASSDRELDIGKNTASAGLADVVAAAALDYSTILPHNWPDSGVCYDDQASYWDAGFAAVVLMDCYEAHKNPAGSGETTPHYHKTTDTIATLDLDRTTEAVRTVVATMATLAVPVIDPITLYAVKERTADGVDLSWTGGAPDFDVDSCPSRDFSGPITRLTPAAGIAVSQWTDPGVLSDGVDRYYRIGRH